MSGAPGRIGMGMQGGAVTFFVRPIDRVANAVWDAVRAAIEAGWTPETFMAEVREAWAGELDEQKKAAMKALR